MTRRDWESTESKGEKTARCKVGGQSSRQSVLPPFIIKRLFSNCHHTSVESRLCARWQEETAVVDDLLKRAPRRKLLEICLRKDGIASLEQLNSRCLAFFCSFLISFRFILILIRPIHTDILASFAFLPLFQIPHLLWTEISCHRRGCCHDADLELQKHHRFIEAFGRKAVQRPRGPRGREAVHQRRVGRRSG